MKSSNKNLNFVINILFLFLNVSAIFSQSNQEKLPLTLNKARQIGLTNDINVLTKEVDLLIAEENIKLSRKELFPELYMDFNLQRNLIIPSTPVPASAFNPNAQEGDLLLLKFSTKWAGHGGLNFNYNIFNPGQKSKLKQSEIKANIADTEKELTRIDAILTISTTYIEALIAREQLKLSEADILTKSNIYNMLSDQYKEGRITTIALNIGKAALSTSQSKQREAQNIADKANSELLYVLGYNPLLTIKIDFEDDIEMLFENYNFKNQRKSLSLDLQKLEQEKQLLNEEKSAVKIQYYPIVNLGAYYGSNYYDNQLDLFREINWHGNSYVKIGVKIPLSDWIRYKNDKSIINHKINSKNIAYENMQNKSALNYVNALKDTEFTKAQYEALRQNFALEEENFSLIQQQFSEGRLLVEDLSKADYAVQLARNEYLNAAYNYLLAELRIEHELSR